MMNFIASVILASSMLFSLATPASLEKAVTFEGSTQREVGAKADHFTVTVQLDIKMGWHICAEAGDGSEVQTSLELNLPEGVKAIGDWNRPVGIGGAELHSEIYVGKVSFSKRVVIDPSAYGKSIDVVVSYQACNDERCNRPKTKTISIAIPKNAMADLKTEIGIFESPVRLKVAGAPLNTKAKVRFPSPAIFDVDGDGQAELVIGSLMGSVGVYENLNTSGTGDPEWDSQEPLKDSKGKRIRTSNW